MNLLDVNFSRIYRKNRTQEKIILFTVCKFQHTAQFREASRDCFRSLY